MRLALSTIGPLCAQTRRSRRMSPFFQKQPFQGGRPRSSAAAMTGLGLRCFRDDGTVLLHISPVSEKGTSQEEQRGSSSAAHGGAGIYIEGELGAFNLLAALAGIEARALPGSRLISVEFEGGILTVRRLISLPPG
jgi:hypothetical protein